MDTIAGNIAIHKYEKLLYKIATRFGLGEHESGDLVKQVNLYATSYYNDPQDRFILRILLSKVMVRKCIFRISNKLFSQNTGAKKSYGVLGYCSDYESLPRSGCRHIPLSIRVVYILNENIGFNEVEIAEILNITSVKVKERFNKARTLLTNR